MSSDNFDRPKWKFDPNTGEPVPDDSPEAEAPSERPTLQSAEMYSAPITGPLGSPPQVVNDTNVDSFRAPYQEQPTGPAPTTPSTSAEALTQPYDYRTQPPTQPVQAYPPQSEYMSQTPPPQAPV